MAYDRFEKNPSSRSSTPCSPPSIVGPDAEQARSNV